MELIVLFQVALDENDGVKLFEALKSPKANVVEIFGSIEGPYAFVFYRVSTVFSAVSSVPPCECNNPAAFSIIYLSIGVRFIPVFCARSSRSAIFIAPIVTFTPPRPIAKYPLIILIHRPITT